MQKNNLDLITDAFNDNADISYNGKYERSMSLNVFREVVLKLMSGSDTLYVNDVDMSEYPIGTILEVTLTKGVAAEMKDKHQPIIGIAIGDNLCMIINNKSE